MKNKKGFTLVEVLGVVVLIAIIFLISYTTILNHFKRSQDKIDENTFSLLKSATKDYMNDNQDDYPEVNKNVFCIDVNTLIDNNYIDEDTVVSKDNKLLAKTMQVSYKDNDYEYELVGSCKERKRIVISSAVQYLLEDANPKSVNNYVSGSDASHQMYTFEHPETDQTEKLTDYRYIGSDPYNYVEFNGELWRIIGVFYVDGPYDEWDRDTIYAGNKSNVKKEFRIKIITDEFLQEMQWNSYNGSNTWPSSSLRGYLNYDYYDNNLNGMSKGMIEPVKNYLGRRGTSGSASYVYSSERGGNSNVTELVGLMYPSDYLYTYANGVDRVCFNDGLSCYNEQGGLPNNGWLYNSKYSQWTISPTTYNSYAYNVSSIGQIGSLHVRVYSNSFRPVLYLKSTVKIISGNGTKEDPYKLSM